MMFRLCLLLLYVAVTCALDCNPLGMEDGRIPDASLTASSQINKWHGAAQGRLNNVRMAGVGVGAWCADKKDSVVHRYIQIDLGSVHKICRIATQGRNTTHNQYVTKYRIHYSTAGGFYEAIRNNFDQTEKVFEGNTDKNSIKSNDLPSIEARFIRVQVHEFTGQMCMRIELFGEAPVVTTPAPTPVITTPAPTTQPPVVCPDGYILGADGKTCEDVDECTAQTDQCNHFCHNTNGSYFCSCRQGFRLGSDNQTCADIDECAENTDGCAQLCIDNDGSFTCACNSGYRLKSDNKGCEDIDECADNTDQCDKSTTSCQNSVGSYSCPCLSGYEMTSDRYKCKDIDECTTGAHQCILSSTTCVNSPGSYSCNCRSGYERDTQFQCKDIDECLDNNGGCSDGCTNLNGGYICTCPDGYELDSTKENCVDKDECALANGGCQHICTNTDGSFTCSCNSGYKLNPDGLTCSDIDECTDGSSLCDSKSTNCNNFAPGYECECKNGYVPIAGDDKKCKAKTCLTLIEPPGTSVSPSTCLNGSIVDDLCKFSCNAGYELPSNEDTLLCLPTGSWNASIINCKRVSCPTLAAPANGNIDPASCATQGNVYLEKCHYSCNSGFEISGVTVKTCGSDGQWDSQGVATCTQLYPDPWITCPDNVIVTLSPGANKADVSALLQDPQSNQPSSRITITPAEYLVDKMFPAGTTILTYVATNLNGKTAQCQATVIVQDKEKPKVSNCPDAIYETTTDNSKAISWTEPTFADNVAVTEVTSTWKPGDVFGLGSNNVHYTGKDAATNAATCEFAVVLRQLVCPVPTTPDNGQVSVSSSPSFTFLTIACNSNKKLFKNAYYVSCINLVWQEIPDCVDYTSPNGDGSCPESYVKQGSLNSAPVENICVKCPRGTFYDTVSKTCEKCAVGFVSNQEGSLQCEACPTNSSTLVEGSKLCTAQCFAGQFSNSGFDLPADLEPCTPCPADSFQNQIGQKGCAKCPNGTGTITTGASSSSDCGGPPMISSFGPNPTNATERQQTQFECYGHGLPLPSFSIAKLVTEGFPGQHSEEAIVGQNGNQIGIRHIITGVKEHDAGVYSCTVTNRFATDTKYLTVNVKLDFSIGKRRRRRSGR